MTRSQRAIRLAACTALLSAFALGCNAPAPPTTDTAAFIAVPDGAEFDRLWETTTRILRKNRFYPTWEDRASGVIRTQPVTAQSWFEWWRRDVADAYSFWEANLHTVQRSAAINLDRTTDSDRFRLSVRVDKSRLSQPERQVTSPAGAIQIFGSRLPTTQGRLISARRARSWLPMGRDPNIEARLLREIIADYGPDRCTLIQEHEQEYPDDSG